MSENQAKKKNFSGLLEKLRETYFTIQIHLNNTIPLKITELNEFFIQELNSLEISFEKNYEELNSSSGEDYEISTDLLKISINKIKSLPLACGNRPAVLMKLFNYQDNSNLRLCYLTNKSCLQCLKLDDSGFMLESVIQCIQQDNLTDNRIYMMACKNDLVATADTDLNVFIWNLKNQQLLASLPRYESLTTCFSFHPTMSYLINCYADRKVNI
jgi:WD40 repeat protein